MTNEIITTLSCCIGSMQLKLSDFGLKKPSFEKILTEKFQSPQNRLNVNKNLNLLVDNHFEYLNPVCPLCGSHHVNKQEYQDRNPILGDFGSQKIYLRRYLCKNCNKKFVTSLDSIIKPRHRYANVYIDNMKSLIETGYRSLRKIVEDFQTFFGVSPSHQSIKNWLTNKAKNRIQNISNIYSGYYCYDEQYLKINGERKYRLTLYDTILNIPVAEEIVFKRTPEAIKNFIQQSTINHPLIAVTTDHFREYKNIMDELGVKHQLCIFHLFKMIGSTVYKLLKSKKVLKREKISLCLYFTDIKNIFRTYDYKIALIRLEILLDKFNNIPTVLKRYISKKVIFDFQRLTHFMRDPLIKRTSNQVENYYRQTEPEQIKTIYKTNKGILSYLYLKMNKWTKKHGKKINTH
jgi:transposase-like protein